MKTKEATPISADNSWVLDSLERGQLVKARKKPIPRRQLKGAQLAILWALRLYLIFMMSIVGYQVWITAR